MQTVLLPSDKKSSICHRMAQMRICTPWPWPTFPGYDFVMWISKKQWGLSKMLSSMISMEVDICHRMGPFRMIMSLIFHFQSQTFSCYALTIKNCASSGCPRQICLDSHGPRLVAPILYRSIHSLTGLPKQSVSWFNNHELLLFFSVCINVCFGVAMVSPVSMIAIGKCICSH